MKLLFKVSKFYGKSIVNDVETIMEVKSVGFDKRGLHFSFCKGYPDSDVYFLTKGIPEEELNELKKELFSTDSINLLKYDTEIVHIEDVELRGVMDEDKENE